MSNAECMRILKQLVAHCDELESHNPDYSALAEDGVPSLSGPLSEAVAFLRDSGDGWRDMSAANRDGRPMLLKLWVITHPHEPVITIGGYDPIWKTWVYDNKRI